MNRHIAVVMDPIERIKTAKDTTFALMLEAQRRGHSVHYVTPGSLGVRAGEATAQLARSGSRTANTAISAWAKPPSGRCAASTPY